MANFVVSGLTELNEAFDRLSGVPEAVKEEILTAMGDVAMEAVKQEGESMRIRSDIDSKHMLDSIALSKLKITDNGGSIHVVFKGTSTDEKHPNKRIRNAAKAFYNEFGTRTQPARPFIRVAIEKCRDKVLAAGEAVFHKWVETNF